MQQIADWLKKVGMSEYTPRFVENDIDISVLPHLTDHDLKELGVSLGHRRRMLAAIAELAGGAVPTSLQPVLTKPQPQDTAERRQVTVMFSDLVGSTALSTRMDPEDLREVISAYQKCVAKAVRRFDGFVARYLGDAVLVYFGYPQAHEDDAERAVRAGLELIAAVAGLKTHVSLRTRVGIATGVVVVGELEESGEARERGIVGETPNVAARLQSIAEPNTVVIAEGTRRLVGGLFELDDLGPKELKGIHGPVRAWAARRASSVESRFEALHPTGLTPLIGRIDETELLLQRWSRAKTGEGQVVLLSGEAGLGKSRLTVALLDHLGAGAHTHLRYVCSPQHTDSALYPIIGQMQRAARLTHDDAPGARLDKLDALLTQTSASIEDATLFAEMLSVPNDGRYPTLDLDPQQRRQRTFQALILQVEALSRGSPVLMIFEDAHWSDPTTLEALGGAVNRIGSLRVLLVVTFRPEFEPPWVGLPHVTLVTLHRLALRDVGTMIDHIVGNKLLAPDIRRDIIERTDGIPLFIEEMTKAILEAGNEDDARRTAAAVPLPALAVPATLQASLLARLDRLGPAKEVAQIGAAIGREFSHAQLAAVVRKSEPELQSALDGLIAAGLLFRQGIAPHATYLFKHALVQDAAYGTLLREPRRALHARIAEVLESQFADIAESQPELLARHYTEAGLIEKAAGLWGKAGQRSLERSALTEAVEQLTRALGQFPILSATPARRREEIKLQAALLNGLQHTKGAAAPETFAAGERARSLIETAEALGEPPEDPLLTFSVLYGFWVANQTKFNGDVICELAAQFLASAEQQGTTAMRMIGHRLMGSSLLCTGQLVQGRAHLDRAIALYDPAQHRVLRTRFGSDTRVQILFYRSSALWALGYPDAALVEIEHALTDARESGHAGTLMPALAWTSPTQYYCGNYAALIAQAEELITLADEKGAMYWKAAGMCAQALCLHQTGSASEAAQKLNSGIAGWRATGASLFTPTQLTWLAAALAEVGQFGDAWRCIGEATTAIETSKESWYEAEVNRMAGELALKSPAPDAAKAEAYFERALAVARQQQAKSFELRAAMSMARLWRAQGRREEARDLLAPIYGWFTEGFDTLDLKETKALLNELA
jgi:class 3 adenylate cyclase/predicted ATPase